MKIRLAVAVALASMTVWACTKEDATSPDGGLATDAGASDGAEVGDARADAADASASLDGDATDAGADAGFDAGADAWTHFEFPEMGFPNGWLVANQGNSPNNWEASSLLGVSTLNLFTHDVDGGGGCANNTACAASQCVGTACRQRVKQKSPRADFGYGRYQWRVYVPAFSPSNAQVSVGAFVYADDAHELDFECGPGTSTARTSATLKHLGGTPGPALVTDMLCYLTSQGNPFVSSPVALPTATWHTLELAMTSGVSSHYAVTWRVDGLDVQTQQLSYGPADTCEMYVLGRKCTWQSFVSIENLAFLGDTYPTVRNDAYFDWFRYGP
jgi:hypothetical protein